EWVHVQLHQQKGMISLSPPTICNSAIYRAFKLLFFNIVQNLDNYSIRFYEVVYLQMLILQGLFA
ncbi:hypothetical protein OIF61_23370, partial [Escherichia coli]